MAKMTVNGSLVEIREPFSPGHVCSAGEADALNQTFRENVRNNGVADIKRTEDKEKRKLTEDEVQTLITDYAADYEFGVRSGPTRDPIESEAMDLARELVRNAIRGKGHKVADFPAAKITELATNYMATPNGVILRERAKALVEARSKISGELNLGDIQVPASGNGAQPTA